MPTVATIHFTCDWCEKSTEPHKYDDPNKLPHPKDRPTDAVRISVSENPGDASYDVCEECHKAFETFMESRYPEE